MSMLSKHLLFVNEQIVFHDKMVEKLSNGKIHNEFRVNQHIATREKFKELSADLIIADKELDAPKSEKKNLPKMRQMSLTLEEVEGLPEELVNELSDGADKTEFAIIGLINAAGGVLSMDRILIGIYKKTGEIFKRNNMTSKLYRMGQKNLVFGVPGKKGFYSTEELTDEDVSKLFEG